MNTNLINIVRVVSNLTLVPGIFFSLFAVLGLIAYGSIITEGLFRRRFTRLEIFSREVFVALVAWLVVVLLIVVGFWLYRAYLLESKANTLRAWVWLISFFYNLVICGLSLLWQDLPYFILKNLPERTQQFLQILLPGVAVCAAVVGVLSFLLWQRVRS